jgi:hypothetical protein
LNSKVNSMKLNHTHISISNRSIIV